MASGGGDRKKRWWDDPTKVAVAAGIGVGAILLVGGIAYAGARLGSESALESFYGGIGDRARARGMFVMRE